MGQSSTDRVVSSHIIVVFDRSGSMGGPFSAYDTPQPIRGREATHAIKIEEAKAQLISWLRSCSFDRVTIIPFSSHTDESQTFALPNQIEAVEASLYSIEGAGGTHLAPALKQAISLGAASPESCYVRLLLITDGLSQTVEEDLIVVKDLPARLGIDAIFIDPTERGEAHVRQLCVRGSFYTVYGSRDFAAAVAKQETVERPAFLARAQVVYGRAGELGRSVLAAATAAARAQTPSDVRVGFQITRPAVLERLSSIMQQSEKLRALVPDSADVVGRDVDHQLKILEDELERVSKEASRFIEETLQFKRTIFVTSVAYPQHIPKGYSASFLVQIYPRNQRRKAHRSILREFGTKPWEKREVDSQAEQGAKITLEVFSHDVEFSPKQERMLRESGLEVRFLGKPKGECKNGRHTGLLTVRNEDGVEIDQLDFVLTVVDHAFDHVSRPLVGQIACVIATMVSIISFILVFVGKVDHAFGLTAGTFAGLLGALTQGWVYQLFRRPANETVSRGAFL